MRTKKQKTAKKKILSSSNNSKLIYNNHKLLKDILNKLRLIKLLDKNWPLHLEITIIKNIWRILKKAYNGLIRNKKIFRIKKINFYFYGKEL